MSRNGPLSVEFQTVAPGGLGVVVAGMSSQSPSSPQVTPRVTSFMSRGLTLGQASGWAQGIQEQIRHRLWPFELLGRGWQRAACPDLTQASTPSPHIA